MDVSQPPPMAVTRRKAERHLSGRASPIKQPLVKLPDRAAPAETGAVCRREPRGWLGRIAALRLMAHARLPPAHALAARPCREGSGGAQTRNLATMPALDGDLARKRRSAAGLADALRAEAARRLAQGRIPADVLASL